MAETRDSIADIWGERAPYFGDWPVRVDQRTLDEPERWVQSACVLCSNGCGMDLGVKQGRIVAVRGRATDRVNRGRLGPKGLHGWEANHSGDRLTRPLIREAGRLREANWDEAMELLVAKSNEIRSRFSSSAIGFYTSGQLFLEEYYTLALIGKAGLGTPHMDGNTRLCTATAAAALKETFGSDGQPGSYADLDVTDAILHFGHNIASQQTVLWARILDRLRGPRPPKLIVIDPRRTETAKEAAVHLAPRVGANVPVINGLLHLIIEADQIDRRYIEEHTLGFEALRRGVCQWPPERVQEISGVPADRLRAAARILGEAKSLVSTVLQGVYQSMQGTAASCQVNNLHLIRGLLGKPGCGILQMNGQPTAQNTRECGADGDLPAFRNWDNPRHVEELARLWNVDPAVIPHWAPPTHAMQIFRYAEQGSIRMLWISGTNPVISLPDTERTRRILQSPDLFVVAQDAFLTETAELADLVLPAAIWGEKTGCFTNVDRTVHISHQAVDPPGDARSDFEIFLEYSRRMEFRDKDGEPLVKWSVPEEAFEAWKECTRGRPCDYTGMSYAKLSGGSGIQWPCNAEHPEGTERLYSDAVFPTSYDECETFGHDLSTGGMVQPERYRADDPRGRAFLKAAEYQPPHEAPDDDYPLWLSTGRVVYHFHTRTKTGRSKALNDAAPDAFVQISAVDAQSLGIAEGDMLKVESRRGRVEAPARVGDIEAGLVFIPFHYGYWDHPDRPRAANELTLGEWDPISKQPYFKHAAVRVTKLTLVRRARQAVEATLEGVKSVGAKLAGAVQTVGGAATRGHVGIYLGLVHLTEHELEMAFLATAKRHRSEPDVLHECELLADWSHKNAEQIDPFVERYSETKDSEPKKLRHVLFQGPRSGGLGLLRDLHDLWLLASEARLSWEVLHQAAQALHDKQLEAACRRSMRQTDRQLAWLRTRIDHAAAQALTVPI